MKKRFRTSIGIVLSVLMIMTMIPILPVAAAGQNQDNSTKRYSVLILDTSGSMYGTPAEKQREAASKFCESILSAEGENYVAVVRLNSSSYLGLEFTNDISTLKNYVESTPASGGTNINQALEVAGQTLDNLGVEGAIKNIILCSDGLPENGNYSDEGPYTNSDYWGYGYANATYDTASSLKGNNYIYTLGFFHSLSGSTLEFGRKFMTDLQNAGYYEVTDPEELEFQFGKIADIIVNGELIKSNFKWAGNFLKGKDSEAVCWYTDDYFLENSSNNKYESHFRTMSLAFELSSWSSYEFSNKEDGWTSDSKAVNARWQNARNLLCGIEGDENYPGLGFDKDTFAVNDFWSDRPTKDSIGLVAASKKLYDGSTLVAMAVRGGGYEQEWASNFTIGNTGDHKGFTKAKNDAFDFLDNYLIEQNITGSIKLWLVGYSRAGVTANMVGGALDSNEYNLANSVTVDPKDLFVYCFEPPQGTLSSKVQNGNYTNIHNVINSNDVVPMVAPSAWDFRRYNSDYWIPNKASTSNFATYRDRMFKVLDDFEGVEDATSVYKVKEEAPQYSLKVNWSKFLPGGEPLIEINEYNVSTNNVLHSSVDFLANGAIGSRTTYYTNWEAGVREIFSLLNGGHLTDLANEGMTMEEFANKFFSQLTLSRICEIIKPAFSINPLYSWDDRKADIKKNINTFVRDVLADSDLWGTVTFVAGFDNSLSDLLWNLFESAIDDALSHNATSIQSVANTISMAVNGGVGQAHYSDLTLAWMMSLDSYYTDGVNMDNSNQVTRIIHINCPVDVEVYDTNNELLTSIIDGQTITESNSTIQAFVNIDGEKIVLLPPDADYRIITKANDTGSVNIAVDEYYFSNASVNRLQNYYDIPVDIGDRITLVVPEVLQDEAVLFSEDGTTTEYTLLDENGALITPDDNRKGNEAQETYNVSVLIEGDNGVVEGGGIYTYGNFAQIQAFPQNGTNFLGWFEGSTLLSEEEIYRFAVTKDSELIARFGTDNKHKLSFKKVKGGTVENVDLEVSEGTDINVVAHADKGYTFSNWDANVGSFENDKTDNTWFTMPDQDVEIKAVFKSNAPSSSGGGSSGTPMLKHSINVNNTDNGSVKSDLKQASAGSNVKLTAIPDEGYEMASISVKTSSGNDVDVVRNDNIFTFKMPSSSVDVITLFKEIETQPVDHNTVCPSLKFDDVDTSLWYHDAIDYVLNHKYMKGTGDTTFEPTHNLTRAMMVQILYNVEGKPTSSKVLTFKDVETGSWYEEAVRWAFENTIVNGYDVDSFAPNDNITREQLVAILYRYANFKGMDTSSRDDLASFIDQSKVSDWALDAVKWAVSENILNGKGNGVLDPRGNATRAEVAQLIMNFFK